MLSFSFFNFIICFMFFIYFKNIIFFKISFSFIIFIVMNWFFDLIMESKTGFLTKYMKDFLKYGFLLFIFSEFMFFFSIFWFFFDTSMTQMMDNFDFWTPKNIILINPFSLPLMNTFILLMSGFSITIFYMKMNMNKKDIVSIMFTIILALLFLMIQLNEYYEMLFSFSESSFSSIFFFSTGFHGIHVFFGMLFILINFLRLMFMDFFKDNMMSMEFSIIYWHFVDIVWLFLFIFIYWWNF